MKKTEATKRLFSSYEVGFSLVELLISMVIIMLIGSVILIVFVTSLRGTEKSQRLITIRQNGNFALSQMTKAIRQAEKSSCDATSVTITSVTDRLQTKYSCSGNNLTAQDPTGTTVPLLDTSKVQLKTCSISCTTQGVVKAPAVTIKFSLQAVGDSSDVPVVNFLSTQLLRNADY